MGLKYISTEDRNDLDAAASEVRALLRALLDAGVITSVEHTTFFLGRENLIATQHPGMARWRVGVFAFLTRNAQPATKFFNIPPDRVFEIGAQIEL